MDYLLLFNILHKWLKYDNIDIISANLSVDGNTVSESVNTE